MIEKKKNANLVNLRNLGCNFLGKLHHRSKNCNHLKKYFRINPSYVSLLMLIGIAVIFIGSVIYEGKFALPKSKIGMCLL